MLAVGRRVDSLAMRLKGGRESFKRAWPKIKRRKGGGGNSKWDSEVYKNGEKRGWGGGEVERKGANENPIVEKGSKGRERK